MSDRAHAERPNHLYRGCCDGRSEEHCLSSCSGGGGAHAVGGGVAVVAIVVEGELFNSVEMGGDGASRLVVLFLEQVCNVPLVLHGCLRLIFLLRLR